MKKNPKILVLATNRNGFHSGNKLYDYKVVAGSGDAIFYGPGYDIYEHSTMYYILDDLQRMGWGIPDIIYSYYTPGEPVKDLYMKRFAIPAYLGFFPKGFSVVCEDGFKRIYGLSDFWHRNKETWDKTLLFSGFDYCCGCFFPPFCNEEIFNSFFSAEVQARIKFLPLPRCVDRRVFKDYGLEKEYDVISLGAMGSHFYPFRRWMHDTLSEKSRQLNIKYRNYPHCGFNWKHTDFVREKYARAINQAKILVSCGGIYNLAMNKIFEAMACGTLYVGEKVWGAENLHLKDGENIVFCTREDLLEKILFYIRNDSERNRIIQNAKITFLKYHHIDARVKDFKKLMEKVYETV